VWAPTRLCAAVLLLLFVVRFFEVWLLYDPSNLDTGTVVDKYPGMYF